MKNKILLMFSSLFGVFALCGLFGLSCIQDKEAVLSNAEDVYFEQLNTGEINVDFDLLNGYTGSYKTGFDMKYYSTGEQYYVTIENLYQFTENIYRSFSPYYVATQGFNVYDDNDVFYNYYTISPGWAFQDGEPRYLCSGYNIYFVSGGTDTFISNGDFVEFITQRTDYFSIPFTDLSIYLVSFDGYYDGDFDFAQRLRISYKFVFSNELGSYNYYFNYNFGIGASTTSNPIQPVFSSYSFFSLQDDIFLGSYTFDLANKPQDYIDGYNTGYAIGYDDGHFAGKQEGIKENQVAYENGYAEGVASQQGLLWEKYQEGYSAGYQNASDEDTTVATIFSNILLVGMLPVNFFLAIFNFEILGINLMSFVSALLSVAVTIIVIRIVTGKR